MPRWGYGAIVVLALAFVLNKIDNQPSYKKKSDPFDLFPPVLVKSVLKIFLVSAFCLFVVGLISLIVVYVRRNKNFITTPSPTPTPTVSVQSTLQALPLGQPTGVHTIPKTEPIIPGGFTKIPGIFHPSPSFVSTTAPTPEGIPSDCVIVKTDNPSLTDNPFFYSIHNKSAYYCPKTAPKGLSPSFCISKGGRPLIVNRVAANGEQWQAWRCDCGGNSNCLIAEGLPPEVAPSDKSVRPRP